VARLTGDTDSLSEKSSTITRWGKGDSKGATGLMVVRVRWGFTWRRLGLNDINTMYEKYRGPQHDLCRCQRSRKVRALGQELWCQIAAPVALSNVYHTSCACDVLWDYYVPSPIALTSQAGNPSTVA
jgi:hypothetical protein